MYLKLSSIMDQIHRSISNKNEGFDVGGSYSSRISERLSENLGENRESLGMQVIAIIVQRYGVLPRELWDLNSISDMGAGRGITYDGDNVSEAMYKSITSNNRYSIVNLSIGEDVNHEVALPSSLRHLTILAEEYDYRLDPLPSNLKELVYCEDCNFNKALGLLPKSLRKLVLGRFYDTPITFPAGSELVEFELGREYAQPLILPPRLKRLTFPLDSQFNLRLALPDSLLYIKFGHSYDQPTILPSRIEAIRIGLRFTHDVSLPTSLRKIEWYCNRPIHIIPEGVSEIVFGLRFDLPVILPTSLKKVKFSGSRYSHPIKFPPGLETLDWSAEDCYGLVLPEGLQKLTWGSNFNVVLPLSLRELVMERGILLTLPEGLLKVTFDCMSQYHYILPASVHEVTWHVYSEKPIFTHRTTLQHLILSSCIDSDVDLSLNKVHKLTIADREFKIAHWPQGLKELAFDNVDDMEYPLRVPKGCMIVGEERPTNVIMEEAS